MAELFFSYSHVDEVLRNELEIHLSALKRQRLISSWHDRRIGAGQYIHDEISEHLEKADIILLLVSPDFIASNYCYNNEVKKALELHANNKTVVIPVILRPCDWHDLPFGQLMATPIDGKPITKFPNRDEAFLGVVEAIKHVLNDIEGQLQHPFSASQQEQQSQPSEEEPSQRLPRSSNLRIRKQFSDRERDQYLLDSFVFIAKFFEGSLSELKNRNPSIDAAYRRIDANHFTSIVYSHGEEASRCTIWLSDHSSDFSTGILYSVGGVVRKFLQRITFCK